MALAKLKWGLLVVTFVYCHLKKENVSMLYVILLVEVLLGFTGYFSAFKDIILITIIGVLSVQVRIKNVDIIKYSGGFIILLVLGLFWTAVKGEYREFLSGGTESQRVVVSKTEALDQLLDQASAITYDELVANTNFFLDRMSYIEFFSIVLSNVPQRIKHENGEIIKESVLFYFKPRIFFPDKGVIDDSQHTNKYTMLNLTGGGQASHSIGFMADAFIDFGTYGMMLLLFALGLMFSLSIIFIFNRSENSFWGIIYIVPFFFFLSVYSFNMMKVIGNFITYFIPLIIVQGMISRFFDRYFTENIE
jgi:hypothetical protein